MSAYSSVIQTGCGIVIMIAIGYGIAKFKVVKPEQLSSLNRFLFRICFTPMIAKNLMTQDLGKLDLKPLMVMALTALTVQLLLTLVMIYPKEDRFGRWLSLELPSTFVNYIIIGLPIFQSIWGYTGDETIVYVVTLSNDILTSPCYLIFTGLYAIHKRNQEHKEKGEPLEVCSFKLVKDVIMGLVTSPIILGYIIGFIWSALKIPVPLFIDELIKYLSETVLSMSCLCIGGFLAEHSLMTCTWTEFVICAVSRHILCPLFAGLYSKLFNFTAIKARQMVILGALPSAVACYVFTCNAGVGAGVSSTMIFWTNIMFIPAIVLWFMVLDGLHIFEEEKAES